MKMTLALPGVDKQSVEMSGTGAIDFTAQKADLKLNLHATSASTQIEMRVVGGKMYTFEDGQWSVVGAGDSEGDSDSQDTSLDGTADPTQYLQYLNGLSPDVHATGDSTMSGAHVTTYAGTIDMQTLLASPSLSPSQRDKIQGVLDGAFATVAPMPFTAALDDQGRLRQLTLGMDMEIAKSTAHMDLTIAYSNFGVAVSITPPPGFEGDTSTSDTLGSTDSTGPAAVPGNRAVQSDLRNALTAEKTIYTDNEKYTADIDELSSVEGSLDWGGTLHVAVSSDKQTVCLWEASDPDTTFSIADVASGTSAGTYYGTAACPSPLKAKAAAGIGDAWVSDQPVSSRSVQSDLRNALTAEKTIYTDDQTYTADAKQLREVESSLAWGTKLHVYVADAVDTSDKGVVCLWELDTSSGKVFSIADVAAGVDAGTFFGTTPCPPTVTPASVSSDDFNTGW
jgi:hypothetical protein